MKILLPLLCCAGLAAQTPAPEVKKRAAEVSVTASEAAETPPTLGVRTTVMLKKFVSFQAFYETVPGTLTDHARNFPKEWGRGGDGFARRLGSQYGQFVLGESIEFAVSELRHEDPRYIYSSRTGAWNRTKDAIVGTFLVPKENSTRRTIALGRISGVFGSWAIATRWEPQSERNLGSILFYGGIGMATKTGASIAREFWPDIRRKYFHKH